MKTVFLTLIAVVGIAVLGGLGFLAFSHSAIPQTDFEQEIKPVADPTAAATPVAGTAIPASSVTAPAADAPAAAPAAPALSIPAEAVVPSTAAPAVPAAETGAAPSGGGEGEEPTTMTVVPAPAATTGVIPAAPAPAGTEE